METIIFIYIFVFGLIVGSFLNVVIFRLNQKKSFVKGRSKCMKCGHLLAVKDLVPLFSFLFLKGKCRYCHKKISPQYFLVELATGLMFGLIYLNIVAVGRDLPLQYGYILLFYIIISSFLIIIFVYDLKHYLILDKVVVPAIIIAVIGNLLLGIAWWDILIGAVLGGGLFLGQFVISRGKWIGGGDIRLGVLMGAVLGWQLVLVALFIAYTLGAIIGLGLIFYKKKKFKDQVPFGTFLTLATFFTMLYGKMILEWYLGLFYI